MPKVPNPMFAAFESSAEEQKAMSTAEKKLTKGTVAHGNAGAASIFLALADRKLAKDGMLAMVMPLSLMTGASWENAAPGSPSPYEGLTVISIAGSDNQALSFSADTNMGECLIIGKRNGKRQTRATFVCVGEVAATSNLKRRNGKRDSPPGQRASGATAGKRTSRWNAYPAGWRTGGSGH